MGVFLVRKGTAIVVEQYHHGNMLPEGSLSSQHRGDVIKKNWS
jgi:hypothetical protein